MSRLTQLLSQLGVFLADILARGQVSDQATKDWITLANVVIAIVLGYVAQAYNTNGTSQRVGYDPQAKPPTVPPYAGLILALCFVPMLSAQTQAKPEQLRADASTEPCRVFAISPNGALVAAICGPGITLDTSVSPPVLRVAVPTVAEQVDRLQATGPVPLWDVSFAPACGGVTPLTCPGLRVYRNGVLQWEGIDYTVSGRRVTWPDTVSRPQTGDLLIAIYR